ncbi:MAG: hypothetical protein D4S01_08430 [Dehalococcoidia bacterium]|nr:MAG: hypothetical protein D4S01_08430 [Dehalococcoidia bacterium]
MAFKVTPKEKKSLEDFFKPITHRKMVLHLGLYGRAKKGKTHFCISSAKYMLDNNINGMVYVIDTEGDFEVNLSTWSVEVQNKVRTFNAVEYLDKKEKKIDLVKSLLKLEDALDLLIDRINQENENSEEPMHNIIIVDSGSDVWEWLSMWLETIETKRSPKDGSMMQTEWGKANKKYAEYMALLFSSNCHLVMTFRAHQAFDGATPLKYDLPKWQKRTDFKLNCLMESKKMGNEYWFYYKGGRFGDISETEPMVNLTFGDLLNKLSTYSSLEFV